MPNVIKSDLIYSIILFFNNKKNTRIAIFVFFYYYWVPYNKPTYYNDSSIYVRERGIRKEPNVIVVVGNVVMGESHLVWFNRTVNCNALDLNGWANFERVVRSFTKNFWKFFICMSLPNFTIFWLYLFFSVCPLFSVGHDHIFKCTMDDSHLLCHMFWH